MFLDVVEILVVLLNSSCDIGVVIKPNYNYYNHINSYINISVLGG